MGNSRHTTGSGDRPSPVNSPETSPHADAVTPITAATLAEAHTLAELTTVLVVSPLQPSDIAKAVRRGRKATDVVRAAVEAQLLVCGDDCGTCVAEEMTRLGEHPDLWQPRHRWARQYIAAAYPQVAKRETGGGA